jgi:regulator of sirC expression with transglutaminase-like and TPR domain
VLFQQHGFTGEIANYDHPNNSSLAHVLKNRKGLPILLSHVVVSVADRVDLPFVGVPIAGRYMVKYDGAQAPAGAPQQDILLDPFGGGKILTWEQLQNMIPGLDRETALDASPKRETVVRMLRNLEADYLETGDHEAAERTASYRWLVER